MTEDRVETELRRVVNLEHAKHQLTQMRQGKMLRLGDVEDTLEWLIGQIQDQERSS